MLLGNRLANNLSWITCNLKLLSIKIFALIIKGCPAKLSGIKAVGNFHAIALAFRSYRLWPAITAFGRHIGSQESGYAFTAKYFKHQSLVRIFTGLFYEATADLEQYISIENCDMIEAAVAEGRGAVLLGAHYGPLLTAYALSRKGFPVRIITTSDWQPEIDSISRQGLNILQRNQWRFRTETLKPLVAQKDEREMVKHVKGGGVALMLVDFPREAPGGGFADFFGQRMRFNLFPFRLALKFNAPTFFYAMEFNKQGFRLRFEPLSYSIPDEGLQNYTAFIQEKILSCPFAWASVPQFIRWFPSLSPMRPAPGFPIEHSDRAKSNAAARS